IRVLSDNGTPLVNARVVLEGDVSPVEGRTDPQGEVTLALSGMGNTRVHSLFVDPMGENWTHYVQFPRLDAHCVNVVHVQSLQATVAGFPHALRYGWGQLAMGLDQLPEGLTGKGIKIAIIDSG